MHIVSIYHTLEILFSLRYSIRYHGFEIRIHSISNQTLPTPTKTRVAWALKVPAFLSTDTTRHIIKCPSIFIVDIDTAPTFLPELASPAAISRNIHPWCDHPCRDCIFLWGTKLDPLAAVIPRNIYPCRNHPSRDCIFPWATRRFAKTVSHFPGLV